MQFYRATYVSRHFEFEAYGETEKAARIALITTLAAHAKQYGIDRNWYEPQDIGTYPVTLGEGLRDQSPIHV